MPNAWKVKQENPKFSNPYVKPTPIDDSKLVSFNFKRLQEKADKFVYQDRGPQYFIKLLERLRNLSSLTPLEMINMRNKTLRCHPIDFSRRGVTEDTFGVPNDDADDNAYQFGVTQGEYGRIHGFFIGNVFYVVWCDPNHRLDPGIK